MQHTDKQTGAQYLTTDETAQRLKLSRRYIEALRRKGGGPQFIAFGRAVRYALEDVDAWAASRKRTSTSDLGQAA